MLKKDVDSIVLPVLTYGVWGGSENGLGMVKNLGCRNVLFKGTWWAKYQTHGGGIPQIFNNP